MLFNPRYKIVEKLLGASVVAQHKARNLRKLADNVLGVIVRVDTLAAKLTIHD